MNEYKCYFTFTFAFGLLSILIPTSIGCIEQDDLHSCNTTISKLVSSKIASFIFGILFVVYWLFILELLFIFKKDKASKNMQTYLIPLGYFCVLFGILFGVLQTLNKTLHYVLATSLFTGMMLFFACILYYNHKHRHKIKFLIAFVLLVVVFICMFIIFAVDEDLFYVFEWTYVTLLFSFPLLFHRLFFRELEKIQMIEKQSSSTNNIVGDVVIEENSLLRF